MTGRTAQRIFVDMPVVGKKEAIAQGLKRYFTGKSCSRGHVAPRYSGTGACVLCSADDALLWQKRAYLEDADGFRAKRRAVKSERPGVILWRNAKSRARKRGIPFSLKPSDIVVGSNCPCCDRTMAPRTGESAHGPVDESPSLDRLDASVGYVPGNVTVICWRCNNVKRDATSAELRRVADWMDSLQRHQPILRLVG